MKEKWRIVFMCFWFGWAGVIICLTHLLNLPFSFNTIAISALYLFTGFDIYLVVCDIIPIYKSWKIMIAWMPALFNDTVFSWMVR